ncbi:hypothetical protein SB781_31425, partial [Paraburkholderia sp. SIMBA_061]
MFQGAAGGAPGIIGRFVIGATNDALGEGREAGLEGRELVTHALGQGAVEGVITTAFSMVGLGGLEKPLRAAAGQGFKGALKQLGIRTAAELPEELMVEVASAMASRLETLEDITPARLRDVAAQTVLTMGAAQVLGQPGQMPAGERAAEATPEQQAEQEQVQQQQ